MAKHVTFHLGGHEYQAAPVKIERKKLYGWSEIIALDDEGGECTLVSVDESGSRIIPKGGTGMGILTPQLRWVDRTALKAVTADGKDAPVIPSSYDTPIALEKTAGAERLLDYVITALYQVECADGLADALGDAIYEFPFNPKADYEGSAAFLLVSNGTVFMLAGWETRFEYLGLSEAEVIEEDEEEAGEEDGDIDFSMF
jgi:hypothetical protein